MAEESHPRLRSPIKVEGVPDRNSKKPGRGVPRSRDALLGPVAGGVRASSAPNAHMRCKDACFPGRTSAANDRSACRGKNTQQSQ